MNDFAFTRTEPPLAPPGLQHAFEAARAASRAAPAPGWPVRRDRLSRLRALVIDHLGTFAAAISADFGHRPAAETQLLEAFPSVKGIDHALRHGAAWSRPRPRRTGLLFRPGRSLLWPQPLGVIGVVVPRNYPLYLAIGPLTGALAAGNRAMVKMPEATPRFSSAFAEAVGRTFAADEVAVIEGTPRWPRTGLADASGSRFPRRLAPAALTGVDDRMRIMQQEIFGPLLPVRGYRSIDDAIAQVEARPRPLALYLFERDGAVIDQALRRTVAGGVTVNDTLLHIAQDDLPFGGVGASGMGAYHGRAGFETFSAMKPVYRQSRLNGAGLLGAPYGARFERTMRLLLRRG